MNSEYLPDIVNTNDLTEHFLYSYAHQNKIGPSNKLRKMFANDLIFDRSRKSIFTQFQEFGYISDKQLTVDMGAYNAYTNSYMDFIAYEGEFGAYQFIPWYITDFKVRMVSLDERKIQVKEDPSVASFIHKISWRNEGTRNRYYFDKNEHDNPIQTREVHLTGVELAYTINNGVTFNVLRTFSGSEITDADTLNSEVTIDNIRATFGSDTCCDNLRFRLRVTTSEFPAVSKYAYTANSYLVGNYVTTFYVNSPSPAWQNVVQLVKENNPDNVCVNDNVGLNSYFMNTSSSLRISALSQSTSGYDFMGLYLPQRITNKDVLFANVDYGASIEMIKVDGVHSSITSKLAYRGDNTKENYNFYLTKNNNYLGHTMTVHF